MVGDDSEFRFGVIVSWSNRFTASATGSRLVRRVGRLSAIALSSVVVLLAVSGCSEASDPSPPDETEPIPSLEETGGLNQDASPGEMLEQAQQGLLDALLARYPDADVPDAELVMTVHPEQWPTVIATCVGDQGFPASETGDGGVEFGTVPPEQQENLAIALYVCSVQYPIDPRYRMPLDAGQIEYLYNYNVQELAPCLETHGFAISDPPSLEVYGESLQNGGTNVWTPYAELPSMESQEFMALLEQCPQMPDFDELYPMPSLED